MKIKTIEKLNLRGKRVILRVDINSPVSHGEVMHSERIDETVKTIKELKKKKAKIIILSHQGRKGDDDFISLKQHAVLLSKVTKVKFIDDICGKKAIEEIRKIKEGEAILLENLRFSDEETENKESFVKILSKEADIFVNDAFSMAHRKHASIVGFPKYLPSYFGTSMAKEIHSLEKIKIKNSLYILGGSKIEELLLLIKPKSKVIVAGKFGQLYMYSNGFKFGKNEEFLYIEKAGLMKKSTKNCKIIYPEDFAVNLNGKRKELCLDKFPNEFEVFDIGEKTIEKFRNEIFKAKAIFMKGPIGYCEEERFKKGTYEILKAISKSKAFSVLGGGHLSTAIKESRISEKKFGHISLSGGALVSYIVGEKLPGIEAIKHQKRKI
jgi:phosphoglycerate kinase